ncbi:MAG: substrate-binding domain-containing protein, partial [Pseudomonadota bacterium]
LDRRFHASPLVSTDHASGSAKVARHLVGLGHRRLAYLSGPQNTEVGRQRLEGFSGQIKALQVAHPDLVLTTRQGQFDYESGEQIAAALLGLPAAERPTGIAAASDQMAIGVLRAARDLGLEVPGDVSVAGFDDITLASLTVPRLTTIAQPTQALSREVVNQILQDGAGAGQDAYIEGELIVRGSTAAPFG